MNNKNSYFIIFAIFLLLSFAVIANATTKDSLQIALKAATSISTKLETLTNLMDLSRQEEQIDYAKQLYHEALKQNNDYYKEAALTEILRYYVNKDIKDSANVYLSKAEQDLKGKNRDFLITYMKTIMDTRVMYYTQGEDRKRIIENYRIKLETEKNLSVLEKMSINYLLGMVYTNYVEPGKEKEYYEKSCRFFNNLITLSDNIPLEYSYLFRLNPFNILSLMSPDTKTQTEYALRYLNMQKEYAATKEMKKRPYVTKRHLLNAYSVLALSAPVLGSDIATSYYRTFMDLNKNYPEDAAFSKEYDRYFTSLNYYKSIRKFKEAADYCDSVIYYFRNNDLNHDLTDNIVITLKEKTDFLDSVQMYKEALYTHKEYAALLDSVRLKNMENRVEDLEIKKNVDELVIEKKALELDLHKSRAQLYLFLALFILAVCAAIYVFFRLDKIKNLYKKLQESNRQVLIASEKAQESERMKNAFIKNICHEVRTPLNAINGFAELITNEDLDNEEKQEFSKIINTNCTLITSMMNDILIIARLDSSSEELPLEPAHIGQLCRHEMDQLMLIQKKEGITYKLEGDENLDLIYTNPTYFNQIISHLLDNANKFTEQGEITLAYYPDENKNFMHITVTDTGCGIPAEKAEWIFDRFTKNDDFSQGTGLGLYLCRIIAERLNGTIFVDTKYTAGARFVLTLPILASA